MAGNFHHLHGHSMFSNLQQPDALPSPEALVERAKELGLSHICITDHASVTGIPMLVKACAKAGIKPIVGTELYVCDDPSWRPEKGAETRRDYQHLVALAPTWEALEELFVLLSAANTEAQFYSKPRNSYAQVMASQHLIFMTACGGGVLARDDYAAKVAELDLALNLPGQPQRFYLEIQPHADERQAIINRRAVECRLALPHLKLVATQDFHYSRPGDEVTHEVVLAIGSKAVWSDPTRWKYPVNDLFVKDRGDMLRSFLPYIRQGILTAEQLTESFATTEEIAERCSGFAWRTIPISLPSMGADPDKQLMTMCIAAMKDRNLMANPEYVHRLQFEFGVIQKSGFLVYFLMLAEIIGWARSKGIMVGPGRGSSGGSLICYLIGITQIDPIVHGLIFERFYRPGRIDLPDIDTDFEDERREEVLDFIRGRFGDEFVANVASYMTLKPKGAIKDVARVFEINHIEANAATTAISVPDIQIEDAEAERQHTDAVLADPAVRNLFARYPVIETHVRKICGFMRGTGQHAAGVVIAGTPLTKHAVVSRRGERAVVNWDKRIIEDMGLMKLDVLGLRTLSILRNAAENVFKSRGLKISYPSIPLDDPKALAVFDAGDTTGVFQFESNGMRALLKGCNVTTFSVISDAVSLYRPGPMELIPVYTAAQTGKAAPHYEHPLLEPILRETHGIIIYQEQMMRIFVDVGGFDYAHADKMRKIVGKKLGPDEFKKHQGDFVEGAKLKGVEEAVANRVFEKMVAFAGYAFNKSHAVAYSVIAFWCAYMKANYPAEFFAAHLSNSDDAQCILAMSEAKRMGIEVDMPSVIWSDAKKFTVVNDRRICAPLCAIKGVGEKAAEMIVGAREGTHDSNGLTMFETRTEAKGTITFNPAGVTKGHFVDGKDFMARIYKRIANAKVQRLLQECGAMPWAMPDHDALIMACREHLGHIFNETVKVSWSDTLLTDEFAQRGFGRILTEYNALALSHDKHNGAVMPAVGSTPKIMVVFEKPSFKDQDAKEFGQDGTAVRPESFQLLRLLLNKHLGITRRELHITGIIKMKEPPLGWKAVEDRSRELFDAEVATLKPPVILAVGKAPIEHFAGKGAKVKELNGKIIMRGSTPVVCMSNPYFAMKDPAEMAELEKAVIALGGLYVE